jgi:hypothetical protein
MSTETARRWKTLYQQPDFEPNCKKRFRIFPHFRISRFEIPPYSPAWRRKRRKGNPVPGGKARVSYHWEDLNTETWCTGLGSFRQDRRNWSIKKYWLNPKYWKPDAVYRIFWESHWLKKECFVNKKNEPPLFATVFFVYSHYYMFRPTYVLTFCVRNTWGWPM